jgi:hypothetical protein
MDAIRGRYKTALSLLGLSDGLCIETQQRLQQLPTSTSFGF